MEVRVETPEEQSYRREHLLDVLGGCDSGVERVRHPESVDVLDHVGGDDLDWVVVVGYELVGLLQMFEGYIIYIHTHTDQQNKMSNMQNYITQKGLLYAIKR